MWFIFFFLRHTIRESTQIQTDSIGTFVFFLIHWSLSFYSVQKLYDSFQTEGDCCWEESTIWKNLFSFVHLCSLLSLPFATPCALSLQTYVCVCVCLTFAKSIWFIKLRRKVARIWMNAKWNAQTVNVFEWVNEGVWAKERDCVWANVCVKMCFGFSMPLVESRSGYAHEKYWQEDWRRSQEMLKHKQIAHIKQSASKIK